MAKAPSNIGSTGSLLTAISTFLIVTIRDHQSDNSGYGLISLHIITTITTSCCYPHHYPSYRYRNHSLPSSTCHYSRAYPEAWVIVTMIKWWFNWHENPACHQEPAVSGGGHRRVVAKNTHLLFESWGWRWRYAKIKTPKWGRPLNFGIAPSITQTSWLTANEIGGWVHGGSRPWREPPWPGWIWIFGRWLIWWYCWWLKSG